MGERRERGVGVGRERVRAEGRKGRGKREGTEKEEGRKGRDISDGTAHSLFTREECYGSSNPCRHVTYSTK